MRRARAFWVKGAGGAESESGQVWLVLGEQQGALRLEKTASVPTLLPAPRGSVCLSVRPMLFNPLSVCCAGLEVSVPGCLKVLFSRGRITGDFSFAPYLKFLPSTCTFFME